MTAFVDLPSELRIIIETYVDDMESREDIAQTILGMDVEISTQIPHTEWIRIRTLIDIGVKYDALCGPMKNGKHNEILRLVGLAPDQVTDLYSELPMIVFADGRQGIWFNREPTLGEGS